MDPVTIAVVGYSLLAWIQKRDERRAEAEAQIVEMPIWEKRKQLENHLAYALSRAGEIKDPGERALFIERCQDTYTQCLRQLQGYM